jgi:hypothetical protein
VVLLVTPSLPGDPGRVSTHVAKQEKKKKFGPNKTAGGKLHMISVVLGMTMPTVSFSSSAVTCKTNFNNNDT